MLSLLAPDYLVLFLLVALYTVNTVCPIHRTPLQPFQWESLLF
jgi:hypothetical protein